MSKLINGFHHAALNTTKYDETIAFYSALGAVKQCEWGEPGKRAAMVEVGGNSHLEVFEQSESAPNSGGFIHLAFYSDDPKTAYEKAMSLGATSHMVPTTLDVDAKPTPFGVYIAFVYGLNGELIEFFQKTK